MLSVSACLPPTPPEAGFSPAAILPPSAAARLPLPANDTEINACAITPLRDEPAEHAQAALPGEDGVASAHPQPPRRWLPMLLSLALHLAPMSLLAMPGSILDPLAAGEEAMDVEMVIAEEATPMAPLSEAQTQDNADTPSPDAAQKAEKKPEEALKPEDTEGEALARLQPEPEATPDKTTAIAIASAAPPPSSEAIRAAASSTYRARIARHLAKFKRFPAHAGRGHRAGQVTVSFSIDQNGQLISTSLIRSSGIGAFDDEALAMIRRAAPFPRSPEGVSNSFTIPVSYRLRD